VHEAKRWKNVTPGGIKEAMGTVHVRPYRPQEGYWIILEKKWEATESWKEE
jgi:hypothetical protein